MTSAHVCTNLTFYDNEKTSSILYFLLKGIINDLTEQKEIVSKAIHFFFLKNHWPLVNVVIKVNPLEVITKVRYWCNCFEIKLNYSLDQKWKIHKPHIIITIYSHNIVMWLAHYNLKQIYIH